MNAQVLILGGGAAGMLAGVQLAKQGIRTFLLEKSPRVGKKLAATGNGRCNLTNTNASEADYGKARKAVHTAMTEFPPTRIMAIFEEMGVVCVPDDAGRVYPMSNQASAVLDALRLSFSEAGGVEITDFNVKQLKQTGNGWCVRAEDGRTMTAPVLVCAMGGQASPGLGGCPDGLQLLKALGHRAKPCFPALTPLKCEEPGLKALKGIRAAGSITLLIDGRPATTETGEILFQDFGLSGIAAMQLAGDAAEALSRRQRVAVSLDLCGEDTDTVYRKLCARRKALSSRPLENFLTGWLPKRLGQTLIKLSGRGSLADLSSSLSDDDLSELANLMTDWILPVSGNAGFGQAQITRGGIALSDVDMNTMQSKLCKGVFIVGEVLDVDAPCGGYNLQWAWASALLAAETIIKNKESFL